MKKYIVPSVVVFATLITSCLCLFSRGRKTKAKPEKQG